MTEPTVETKGEKENVAQEKPTEQLKQEVLISQINQINNKTDIPFEKITEEKKPENTVAKLIEEIKKETEGENPDWNKVIKIAFSLFFNSDNEVNGLGFFVQGIEGIDEKERVGIFNELEKINNSKMDWKEKMKISLLKAEIEYSLYKKGYDKVKSLKWNGEKGIKIEKGKKLEDYVESSIWKKIKTKMILGALSYDKELPEGAYLFFDKDGYPIFISKEENPSDIPSVQIFEKVAEERENETKVDFLQKNLKVGDVLFLNERSEKLSVFNKYFVNLGRTLQAGTKDKEAFHAIHVAVVTDIDEKGEVYISQVLGDGGRPRDSLREMMSNKYKGLSVGRLEEPEKAKKNAENALKFAEEHQGKGYGWDKIFTLTPTLWMKKEVGSGFLGNIARVFQSKNDQEKKPVKEGQGVICWDIVQQSAQEESNLAKAETAIEMFDTMEIVYSMAF